MSGAPVVSARPSLRRRWVLVAGAVVVVALAVIGVKLVEARMSTPIDEPTAWDTYLEMSAVLAETADTLGLDAQPWPDSRAPLACTRDDGGEGVSYFLDRLEAVPPEDVDALVATVRELWVGRGYDVQDRAIAEAKGLVGVTELGAVVQLLAGPGSTVLSGETHCALVDGAPEG